VETCCTAGSRDGITGQVSIGPSLQQKHLAKQSLQRDGNDRYRRHFSKDPQMFYLFEQQQENIEEPQCNAVKV
jgi:hypothetical protein